MSWFVGVDVGGTFTDVVVGASGPALHVAKVLTTPEDPLVGVLAGVEEALAVDGTATATLRTRA